MLHPIGMKSRPGPSLLVPEIIVCALLVAVIASMPADKCPVLDCAHEKRHFCPPGSIHCGLCLAPYEESEEGQCVLRKRQAHSGKMTSRPVLDGDEEIDFLSAVIAKQQGTAAKQSVAPNQVLPKANPVGHKQKKPSNTTAELPKTSAAPTVPPLPPSESSERGHPLMAPYPHKDRMLITVIGVCVIVGMVALILSAVCWIRQQKDTRLAQKVDYPAYSGEPPASSSDRTSPGDKKLAQNAQMYHYQHQKQQMLSMEKHKEEPKVSNSVTTSDEENEDGDFTVYECPGLAPTGEMEVKNPLFDDSTLYPQSNHK